MAPEILINIKKRLNGDKKISTMLIIPADSSWTVIFGSSGAGKSTILRTLAGLDRSDKGLIKFGGET